jgi:multimeric flavodoxin WrbA
MKAAIIKGGSRCQSTLECLQLFLQEFSKYDEVEIKEFSLPKDMPHYCHGCNSCILNGEDTCPHYIKVKPIVDALIHADLIIMTSSVYGLDVSEHLNFLLDHLCYMWINHRPYPEMFQKIALTVTTTAGTGLSHATKTMKNTLTYLGAKKIFTFKRKVPAIKWEELTDKRKKRLQKEIIKKTDKIHRALSKGDKLHYPIARRLFFIMMRGMMNMNNWNQNVKSYWESQGWLGRNRPF